MCGVFMKSKLAKYLGDYLEQEAVENCSEPLTGDVLKVFIAEGIDAFESTEDCKIETGRPTDEIVRKIDKYYFESVIGRRPNSQAEIRELATEVANGIDVSADWRTIHEIAKDKIA